MKQYAEIGAKVKYRSRWWLLHDKAAGWSFLSLLPNQKPFYSTNFELVTFLKTREEYFEQDEDKLNG
jgi:hypothetical protein